MRKSSAPHELPRGLRIVEDFDATVIRRTWWSRQHLFLLLFTLVWNGFIVTWFLSEHDKDASAPWIHVGIGVALAYVMLACTLNRTDIELRPGVIRIRTYPIPWARSRTISVSQLEAPRIQYTCDVNGEPRFGILCRTPGNREVKLIGGLRRDQAEFVEEQLRIRTGMAAEGKAPKHQLRPSYRTNGSDPHWFIDIAPNIDVSEEAGGTRIRRTWKDNTASMLTAFTLIWNGLLIFPLALYVLPSLIAGEAPEFKAEHIPVMLFLSIFYAFGALLAYATLSTLFNKTDITLNRKDIVIKSTPFPWPSNNTLARSAIRKLHIESQQTCASLRYTTPEGKERTLIRNLPEEQAVCIARLIAKHLAIPCDTNDDDPDDDEASEDASTL